MNESKGNKSMTRFNGQFFNSIEQRFTEISSLREFKNESSFAVQILHGNSYLSKIAQSNPTSLLKAVMNVAQTGLTLNPIEQLSYLVPMAGEIVLMPSYKGLVKLLTDTGSVETVYSHLVYEDDVFEVSMGSECDVIHKRTFKSKNILGCYAIAHLKTGQKQVEFMDVEQLHKIRGMSEQYKAFEKRGKKGSCIWIDHGEQMMRKTVIKRLCNQLPRTDQFQRVAKAIELDNQEYKVSDDQRHYIDTMLEQYQIPVEVEDRVRYELLTASSTRAGEIIEELREFRSKSLNDQFQEIVLANPSTPLS